MKLDWKKLLGQALRVLIAAAIGVATVANDAVPSFLVADGVTEKAIKMPEKKGNDYALTVSYDISQQAGVPGQRCIQQIATITLRGGIGNYKVLETKAQSLIVTAFGSKLCPESPIYVTVGGAMPYGYYGDKFAVIAQPIYEAQQPVGPIETK